VKAPLNTNQPSTETVSTHHILWYIFNEAFLVILGRGLGPLTSPGYSIAAVRDMVPCIVLLAFIVTNFCVKIND